MSYHSLDEILRLSVPERLQIVEDIWDSIAATPDQIPVTDAQRAELDRRLEAHAKDPSSALPWDEVRSRISKGD